MSSISGEINYNYSDLKRDYHNEMLKCLKHRGPDQDGIYYAENACLIHTRLSVVDIEKGSQPMKFKNLIIVYNGELYNTEELRKDLFKDGYRFEGYSDTEVLIKAYDNWGESMMDRLNGIFAFAIYNEITKENDGNKKETLKLCILLF